MRRSKIGRLVTLAGQLVQDLLNFAINNSCKGRRPGVTMRWGDAFLRERDGKRIGVGNNTVENNPTLNVTSNYPAIYHYIIPS
ncbi:hypothetical protein VTJ04DRAFT_847 [Mycothermus thermophilus]|uniref:uncharacterized protein n=1 Tax=Humicola insolens TaxID=85995 RepID=UPI0037446482